MTSPHAALWPRYDRPVDLAEIETVPLDDRGLPATTYDALARAASLWPARTALRVLPDATRWEQPVERTYAQLLEAVAHHAAVLRAAGVDRDDAVAVLSPNCLELVETILAAQRAGIVAPINPAMDGGHVADLLRRSGARVLVAAGPELDSGVVAKLADVIAGTSVEIVFLLRPTGGTSADVPSIPGARIVAYLADAPAGPDVDDTVITDDIASLFHTGGTTGTPKLAAHTHRNELANSWMIAANSVLDEDSVLFAALPLFHVNALMVTVLSPILRGQTVVWAGPLGYRDPALYGVFWRLVERHRIATMSAVPTVYSVLAQCPVDADISSLRACIVGASMLPPAVRTAFESHTGTRLLEGYGLTEATCASVRSFLDGQPAGSVGQRMPYQYIRAVDESWGDVPDGVVGRIVVSGPTVFAGYVRARSATGFQLDTAGSVHDGWLDTGDLGSVTAEGFLTLTGRAKDLIIRGGHNIDPGVVEDVLLDHPDVTGAGVVGRPDVHSGEVPVGYVTLRADASVTGEQLATWASRRVSEAAAAPKAVTVVDALPMTDVGKPHKLALRATATTAALRAALDDAGCQTEVSTRIDDGAVVAVVTPHVDPDTTASVLDGFPIRWEWADILP
ncbi:acyl-CoA synthetase [Gordonia sp. TBRC 11910]|uniref:Acyl-CoA synthetase n=1 Tax=Gordonia asplenii TaxID=2725283 RepID=A0A848L0U7_9ACTN|nr:acyl-CoA synthetase [Gordonia asplenii]NMO04504.1 acyl-CoA synthetase [Gordonia asplenii]